jgi:hypothetical protein
MPSQPFWYARLDAILAHLRGLDANTSDSRDLSSRVRCRSLATEVNDAEVMELSVRLREC